MLQVKPDNYLLDLVVIKTRKPEKWLLYFSGDQPNSVYFLIQHTCVPNEMSFARLLCYPKVWQTSVSLNRMFVTSERQANAKDLKYERSASFAPAAVYRKLGLLASGCIFRSWTARQRRLV